MKVATNQSKSEYGVLETSLSHVGIIMDGNRRFAKRLMMQPWKGHEWGEERVEQLLGWCTDLGIKALTLYTLSLENIAGRPKMELDYIYRLMERVALNVINNKNHVVHVKRAKVNVIGRKQALPVRLRKLLARVEAITRDYDGFEANFAIAYSSRAEIIDAVKRIAKLVKEGKMAVSKINEATMKESLYEPGMRDPDLIIRTGGEKRLSNFLLFQSAYSELCFIDKPWPEFSKEDLMKAINDFRLRQRRFGA